MEYEIHITEHGKDTVSVSLEWTRESPKVTGFYFVQGDFGPVSVHEIFDIEQTHYFKDTCRWLGPIPIPPA